MDESREDSATPPDFETFFMAQHRSLFQALWVMTRNAHEAEEIMQDAFLKLWERWDRVKAVSDPTGYLYRTAMNVFRRRVRRTRMAVRKAVGHLPPDDGLAAVESGEAIVRALAPLTPRQRAAVVLMDVLDLTSEQAGAALGIPHGSSLIRPSWSRPARSRMETSGCSPLRRRTSRCHIQRTRRSKRPS